MKIKNAKELYEQFKGRQSKQHPSFKCSGIICGYSTRGLIVSITEGVGWFTPLFGDFIEEEYKDNVKGYIYISRLEIA